MGRYAVASFAFFTLGSSYDLRVTRLFGVRPAALPRSAGPEATQQPPAPWLAGPRGGRGTTPDQATGSAAPALSLGVFAAFVAALSSAARPRACLAVSGRRGYGAGPARGSGAFLSESDGVVREVVTIAGERVPTERFVEADVGMKFPKFEISERLYAANGPWPDDYPFPPEAFGRQDETDDEDFYAMPRLCYHIDEGAVRALTNYYKENIAAGSAILDICSSWVSHYPADFPKTMSRISGTGMNALELEQNDQLTDNAPLNLNVDAKLPYDDESFDVVTCVVSVDYLIKPLEVFREVNRVLKPGGKFILSQSNRCFPSKAIAMWLGQNDLQHCLVISAYFHYSTGWTPARIFDASPQGERTNDPLYIIEATKGEQKPLDASRWLQK